MDANEVETLRSILQPLFAKAAVKRAVLFGSAARGSQTRRSDLDIMIVKETEKRFFDRYDEFDEIFDLFPGRAIDLLIYTPQELEHIAHRSFIKRILREGKVLYEH